jgi:hypothetical protein
MFGALMTTSALLALIGVFVLTDVGQLLKISKDTVVVYFQNHLLIMLLSVVLFGIAVYFNRRFSLVRGWVLGVFGAFLLGCFVVTKYLVPYVMFPAQQHAVYKPIEVAVEASYLEPDDTVYVVAHNDVTRAFPQKYLWVSHIFGGDYGGEEVVLTYCVLTNLPVPYVNDLDGEPMDLKVLAQTNNNLLMWDTRSGEIIQQINNRCELSQRQLEPLPITEMTWESYQTLFPEGEVLYNPYEKPLEKLLDVLMPLDEAHSGEKWMFNTVALDDTRLPSKEKIVGIKDGEEAIAFTRDYLREAGIVNTAVGDQRIVIAHTPEHDIFVAFDRTKDGKEIQVDEVDVFGNTPDHGQLEPAFIYNGPMWAVWLHYHPDTKLFTSAVP